MTSTNEVTKNKDAVCESGGSTCVRSPLATSGRRFPGVFGSVPALTLALTLASAAMAQEEQPAAPPATTPQAEQNQEAPAAPAQKPWDTNCSQTSRQAEPDCVMSQIVIVPKSRQVLLRVEVRVPGDQSGTSLMLQLPHGVYLPEGVKLGIDKTPWQETEYQTCDGNGCYAALKIDEAGLDSLRRGAKLTVSFQSMSHEVVTVPVDLNGFSDAYSKIR